MTFHGCKNGAREKTKKQTITTGQGITNTLNEFTRSLP